MEINTGLAEEARQEIAGKLAHLLADTYTLYIKTHGYHWNVSGPMFRTLHLMFEEHYMDLREAVDEIAERMLALGYPAPASNAEFIELAEVEDEPGVPGAMDMVRRLVTAHETLVRTARAVVAAAEEAADVATADLATVRIETHEKTAWMLRATAS